MIKTVKKIPVLLIVFGILILLSSACYAQTEKNQKVEKSTCEKMLEGTWRRKGYTDESRRFRWFVEWKFDGGKFTQTDYPSFQQTGGYRVLKTDDKKLPLKLYEQSGTFGKDNKEIEIICDAEQKTLTINGQAPFKKYKKQEGK